jgi:ketosteroid isomerase-like protein
MKRTVTAFVLCAIALLVIGLTGCQQAAPETNRNAAPEPTKEPFNPAAIEAEVLKLDREWAGSIVTKDVAAIRRIEADDISLVFPDGTVGSKADDIRDMEAGNVSAESLEIFDAKVKVLDADAAVVTGRSVIKKGKYKRPDGKMIDISGEYRFTDVFARRNGTWQVVASQATKILEPGAPPPPSPVPTRSASPSPSRAASPAATRTP